MFDFSFGKLLLLALIALLVLGPDKLPGAARTAGTMLRRLRAAWDNVRSDLERELEIEEMRRAARQAAAEAEAAQNQASETLHNLRTEMEKARVETARLAAADAVVAEPADAVTESVSVPQIGTGEARDGHA